jgi:hypothetical protein
MRVKAIIVVLLLAGAAACAAISEVQKSVAQPRGTHTFSERGGAAKEGGRATTLLGVSNGIPGKDLVELASFVKAMGQSPDIVLQYINETHPVSVWVGDQDWSIRMQRSSPREAAAIPMIGLAMNSTVDGFTAEQFFQRIAAGAYDSVYRGILAKWRNAGYRHFYIRPGWEMNGDWTPWSVTPSNLAAFKKAFAHIASLAHAFPDAEIKVDWSPTQAGVGRFSVEAADMYPGDRYVDIICIDHYGYAAGGTPNSKVFLTTGFTALTAAQFAARHNKPFGLDETGAGSTDAEFPANLAQAIVSVPGVRIDHVVIWDRPDGGKYGSLFWSDTPEAAAAWKAAFARIRDSSAAVGTTR